MKYIKLTRGKYAIVNDEDFEHLNKYKWYAHKSRDTYYAYRGDSLNGKKIVVAMHRQILGLSYQDGLETDHRNHNGLDNRRDNIRICTRHQNSLNQLANKNTTSKYKGVSRDKNYKKWHAHIKIHQKSYYIGKFDNEIDAAKAYDIKAKELFGEFAYLNF